MRRPRPAALAFWLTAALVGALVGQQPGGMPRAGEQCPTGRWYTEGGNAARNASSANAPVLRRPVLAWRQAASGTILGEPRVWGDYVVIAVRVDDKRRAVEVRRLVDGSLVGRRELNSTSDPCPTLWGNEIIWRVGEGSLELLRFNERGVAFVRRMRKARQVGPPLRLGMHVYAVVEGELRCMRAADFRVIWRSQRAAKHRGPVSIVDDVVYSAFDVANQQFAVVADDRRTGKQLARSAPIDLQTMPGDDLRIQAAGRTLLLRFGEGQWLRDYRLPKVDLNGIQLKLPLRPGDGLQPMAMPVLHALDTSVHIASMGTPTGPQLAQFPIDKDDGIHLNSHSAHSVLLDVPPTLVRDVMYFGACAVDRNEHRILWRIGADGDQPLPKARIVPAGRSLLLAGERELWALREDVPPDPVPGELQTAWRAGRLARLQPLVEAAIKAVDWDQAVDLLARCRSLNAAEDWATKREKAIANGRKNKRRRIRAATAEKVRADAEAVADGAFDDVAKSIGEWPNTRSAAEYRSALRFVLAQRPADPATVLAVRSQLPKGIEAPEPFLASDWLDFIEAAAHTEVGFLDASLAEFGDRQIDADTRQSKQQLLEWRSRWRPDLQALRSERLLLFSPITQPGSLARSLATGELVCDLLESLFANMPKVRTDPRPMLVFIYPDRAEYLLESKKLGTDIAEWAAGYYSDGLNELVPKSRMFVPSDEAGFNSVLPTLAHELTHQWLMDRCPAFQPDPIAARVGPKAFWIVEGFASLVEQFEFDLVRREFRLANGSLTRADLVASAHEQQMLPWQRLVDYRRRDFAGLAASKQVLQIRSSLRLGRSYPVRAVGMFYAQSAMLARYLYAAENARYRQQLLDFVVAYYTGAADKLDFETAFGVEAEELGPKIVAFSRSLLN